MKNEVFKKGRVYIPRRKAAIISIDFYISNNLPADIKSEMDRRQITIMNGIVAVSRAKDGIVRLDWVVPSPKGVLAFMHELAKRDGVYDFDEVLKRAFGEEE